MILTKPVDKINNRNVLNNSHNVVYSFISPSRTGTVIGIPPFKYAYMPFAIIIYIRIYF